LAVSTRTAPLIYITVLDGAGNKQRVLEQTHRVKSLKYTDSEKKADKLVITVDNFDLANFDDPIWSHGNRCQVSWGYPGRMALARTCIITKVTGFTELKVEAKAETVLMDTQKKSRTFKGMSRSAVVRKIAKEYGYDATTMHVEDTGAKHAHIVQANLTDAQFVRRLAHQQGFEFYVDYEGFHFHEAKLAQVPIREFIYFTDPGRGDVIKINVETDVTRKPAEVKKTVRDPLNKTTSSITASNSTDSSREGTAEVLLLAAPDLKSAELKFVNISTQQSQAPAASLDPVLTEDPRFDEPSQNQSVQPAASVPETMSRGEYDLSGLSAPTSTTAEPASEENYTEAQSSEIINNRPIVVAYTEDGPVYSEAGADMQSWIDPLSGNEVIAKDIGYRGYEEDEDRFQQSLFVYRDQGPLMCAMEGAEAEAKAKFRRAQKSAVKMKMEAVGDPNMLAKTNVRLSGVGKRLSGVYHVQEVEHDVGPGKYEMTLKLYSDGTGALDKKTTQSLAENGLPSVNGVSSTAKKPPPPVTNTASVVAGQSIDPQALIPVPLLDKNGNQIGTTWAVRAPTSSATSAPKEKTVTFTAADDLKSGYTSTEGG
jgi:phage protein D